MDKTFLIFGDSIVWGAWDPEGGGWAERLRRYLMQQVETETDPENPLYNLGIRGETTVKLAERFKREAEARITPQRKTIVIIGIGTNDSSHIDDKEPSVKPELFRKNLQTLTSLARQFADTVILAGLTVVDEAKGAPAYWDKTIFYRNSYLQAYNKIIEEVAVEASALFIDIQKQFAEGDYRTFLDPDDGLHPNSKGHEKIFEIVRDFLTEKKIIEETF
jgi:lysophospholipase L1-like esterase